MITTIHLGLFIYEDGRSYEAIELKCIESQKGKLQPNTNNIPVKTLHQNMSPLSYNQHKSYTNNELKIVECKKQLRESFIDASDSELYPTAQQDMYYSSKSTNVQLKKSGRHTGKFVAFISYVRTEASIHAIRLEKALEREGISTYLDTMQLLPGEDWQDALRDAVDSCCVFVPLITSSYGRTLWTSREFKLADCLSKIILPVNFCNSWPPPSLAIHLASVQYVNCIPDYVTPANVSSRIEELVTVNNWSKQSIYQTANIIKFTILKKVESKGQISRKLKFRKSSHEKQQTSKMIKSSQQTTSSNFKQNIGIRFASNAVIGPKVDTSVQQHNKSHTYRELFRLVDELKSKSDDKNFSQVLKLWLKIN